ncbi:MAG: hypothetical protein GY702_09600 [Desulfobulbaceae bacterium]|nr:hypothetical protein [Desulfobulbaceae bacterium]
MSKEAQFKIKLTFNHPNGSIPSGEFRSCLAHIEDAILSSERADLNSLDLLPTMMLGEHILSSDPGTPRPEGMPKQESWPQIPSYLMDAMQLRLDDMRGRLLYFEYASSGSIVLGALVAACSYWVIKNTLGEVFQEAWRETEMRSRIKKALLWRFGKKRLDLAADIKERIERDGNLSLDVATHISNDGEIPIVVYIEVTPKYDREEPPLSHDLNWL